MKATTLVVFVMFSTMARGRNACGADACFFLCTDQYGARYMPEGRGKEAPDTGTNHLGFRLVRDAKYLRAHQ